MLWRGRPDWDRATKHALCRGDLVHHVRAHQFSRGDRSRVERIDRRCVEEADCLVDVLLVCCRRQGHFCKGFGNSNDRLELPDRDWDLRRLSRARALLLSRAVPHLDEEIFELSAGRLRDPWGTFSVRTRIVRRRWGGGQNGKDNSRAAIRDVPLELRDVEVRPWSDGTAVFEVDLHDVLGDGFVLLLVAPVAHEEDHVEPG